MQGLLRVDEVDGASKSCYRSSRPKSAPANILTSTPSTFFLITFPHQRIILLDNKVDSLGVSAAVPDMIGNH